MAISNFVFVIWAAVSAVSAPASPAFNEPKSTATGTIVIYRTGTLYGAIAACPVRYKGQEIVELGRGKYAEWVVPPGRYILGNKVSSIEVSVEPGETRYVRCNIGGADSIKGGALLQIVDGDDFEKKSHSWTKKPIAPLQSK